MIDFDEEKKKFRKSLEIDELNDALANCDITDMDDIMIDIIKQFTGNKNSGKF